MIILSTSSDLIQIVTASSVQLDVQASYMDLSTANILTPGRLNQSITTNATTTVTAGPSSGTRTVKHLSIANAHASSSNVTTIQHYDGTTTVRLIKVTLLAGYTLVYDDAGGWIMTDPAGTRIQTSLPGRFLGLTLLTAASSTFTVSPYTNTIKIRGVAGGGAGGGNTSAASQGATGAGGGAGGYAEKTFTVTPRTAYTYTCGTAGTPGATGANAGGNGGNGTFIVGGTTVTVFGGTGGSATTVSATLRASMGGAGGVVSTNGDVNTGGAPGLCGYVAISSSASNATSGAGGSGYFGKGGIGLTTGGAANGVAGIGFGTGGGGGFSTAITTNRSGGAGTAGCWIVEEYT